MPRKTSNKMQRNERVKRIKEIIRTSGYYGLNRTKLAEELNVDRETITRDIESIIDAGLDPKELQEVTVAQSESMKTVLEKMHKALENESVSVQVKAARVLVDALEKQTDYLERFGFKDITTPVSDTNITVSFGKRPEDKVVKGDKKK